MGTWREGAVVAVLVVLLAPSLEPVAASFLQAGYDAARTGNSPDDGPTRAEVAFRVRIPGSRAEGAPPLISNGAVFVLTFDGNDDFYEPVQTNAAPFAPDLTTNGLFRIPLATGKPELVGELPSAPHVMAIDRNRVIIATQLDGLQVRSADTFESQWTWEYPQLSTNGRKMLTRCNNLAFSAGHLYVGCSQERGPTGGVSDPDSPLRVADVIAFFAVRLDVQNHTQSWVSFNRARDGFDSSPQAASSVERTRSRLDEFTGISVIDPVLLVSTRETIAADASTDRTAANSIRGFVRALNLADGAEAWRMEARPTEVTTTSTSTSEFGRENIIRIPASTGRVGTAFTKVDGVVSALNPSTGEVFWNMTVGKEDALKSDLGSGFAFDGDFLYATSAQTIYKVNVTSRSILWTETIEPNSNERWAHSGLVLANGTLYGLSVRDRETGWSGTIRAHRAIDGKELFRHELKDNIVTTINETHFMFSVGDGVLAVAGFDGYVTLVGRTAASIQPVVRISTNYPPPTVVVNVTLEDTRQGAQGRATEFKADWGDGNATDWKASPRFSHAYATAGDHKATFWARNDAGQSAAEDVTFHVGAIDPALASGEKTDTAQKVVETAAAPENQNLVFFVVGLALTGAGAAVGAWALRRKRNRLRQELRAVESAYERAKRDPARTEAAMRERRKHARAMFEARKLDEAQLETLSRRIDELSRQSRLDVLDDKYRFLPYGIVVMLRGMLEDNRMSAMDRANAIAAIEREEGLTAGQKEQARRIVDEWFRQDAR